MIFTPSLKMTTSCLSLLLVLGATACSSNGSGESETTDPVGDGSDAEPTDPSTSGPGDSSQTSSPTGAPDPNADNDANLHDELGGGTCFEAGETQSLNCVTCTCSDAEVWECVDDAACSGSSSQLRPCEGEECDPQCGGESAPDEPCENGWSCEMDSWACLNNGDVCPEPREVEGACGAVVGHFEHPETGLCCTYGTACTGPEGWTPVESCGE